MMPDTMLDTIETRFTPEITYAVHRKCTPGWMLPRQIMPIYDLAYIVSGRGRYTIHGAHYDVESGDLLCTHPGSMRESHTFPDRLMTVYAVDFHLNPPGAQKLPFAVKTSIGRRKDLIQLFNELSFTWIEKRPGHAIKSHGLLLLILHRLYELCVYDAGAAEDDSRIKKAVRYIAARYAEKITVEKMAALTRLQPQYFNALFKRKTGSSMHQYLIRTRIRNAHTMLLTGEYTVAETAELCGYTDIGHFHKQFKLVMDIAPSQCIPKC